MTDLCYCLDDLRAGPVEPIRVAIDFRRGQPFVKADKVALFGYGHGAIFVAILAMLLPETGGRGDRRGAYDCFTGARHYEGSLTISLPCFFRVRFMSCSRAIRAF
jgi:hypothetical protein